MTMSRIRMSTKACHFLKAIVASFLSSRSCGVIACFSSFSTMSWAFLKTLEPSPFGSGIMLEGGTFWSL